MSDIQHSGIQLVPSKPVHWYEPSFSGKFSVACSWVSSTGKAWRSPETKVSPACAVSMENSGTSTWKLALCFRAYLRTVCKFQLLFYHSFEPCNMMMHDANPLGRLWQAFSPKKLNHTVVQQSSTTKWCWDSICPMICFCSDVQQNVPASVAACCNASNSFAAPPRSNASCVPAWWASNL